MRRSIGFAVVAAALAASTFTVAASVGSEDAPTIRLFDHDTSQANLDLGAKGASPGDQFVFAGDVFDRKGGTKLGRTAGYCMTVSASEVFCAHNFVLPGGQIAIQSLFDSSALFGGKTLRIPITGGTGIYRNARGDGTVQLPNQTDANFVLQLGAGGD